MSKSGFVIHEFSRAREQIFAAHDCLRVFGPFFADETDIETQYAQETREHTLLNSRACSAHEF